MDSKRARKVVFEKEKKWSMEERDDIQWTFFQTFNKWKEMLDYLLKDNCQSHIEYFLHCAKKFKYEKHKLYYSCLYLSEIYHENFYSQPHVLEECKQYNLLMKSESLQMMPDFETLLSILKYFIYTIVDCNKSNGEKQRKARVCSRLMMGR